MRISRPQHVLFQKLPKLYKLPFKPEIFFLALQVIGFEDLIYEAPLSLSEMPLASVSIQFAQIVADFCLFVKFEVYKCSVVTTDCVGQLAKRNGNVSKERFETETVLPLKLPSRQSDLVEPLQSSD